MSAAWSKFLVTAIENAQLVVISPTAIDSATRLDVKDGFNAFVTDQVNIGPGFTSEVWFVALDSPAADLYDSRLLGLLTGFAVATDATAGGVDDSFDFLAYTGIIAAQVQALKQDILTTLTDAVDPDVGILVGTGPLGLYQKISLPAAWETSSGAMMAMDRMAVWTLPSAPPDSETWEPGGIDSADTLTQAAILNTGAVVTVLEQIANTESTVAINQGAAAFSIQGSVNTET